MKHHSEFAPEEQRHSAAQHEQQSSGHEFSSPEEMLRFDAQHIPVPPRIADRLHHSLRSEPAPRGSWWKRLFSK